MRDPEDILKAVLDSHDDHIKWKGTPFEKIKRISNAKVGAVGQDFVEKLCESLEFCTDFPRNPQGERAIQNSWDMKIENITFEIKTASEDTQRNFQFNHIRYHREYDAVLCVGISPTKILFGAWPKEDIATGRAGRLVSMEKGANASYKLTKREETLSPISEFHDRMSKLLTAMKGQA